MTQANVSSKFIHSNIRFLANLHAWFINPESRKRYFIQFYDEACFNDSILLMMSWRHPWLEILIHLQIFRKVGKRNLVEVQESKELKALPI